MNQDSSTKPEDEPRPEYDFEEVFKGGVRGEYAERYKAGTNVVVLAADILPSEQDVNEASSE